jgi:hypothetical protein
MRIVKERVIQVRDQLRSEVKDAPQSSKGRMSGRFEVLEIVTELPEGRREQAVQEIRGVLGLFEQSAADLNLDQDIQVDILLVENLDPHVDRIMQVHGRFDTVGPYRSIRNTVAAYAITLRDPRHASVRASIVVNQGGWLTDHGHSVLLRVGILVHEIAHLLQQAQGRASDLRRGREPCRSHDDSIRFAAQILWEEFDADIVADRVCRLLCKTADGTPIGYADVNRYGLIESVETLLSALCDFARDQVQHYRIQHSGLEELYPRASSLLGELFLVLAHAAAQFHSLGAADELTTLLKTKRGFEVYVGEDWERFVSELRDSDGALEAVDGIATLLNNAFARVGLQIEDYPDGGMFVHVSAPLFCSDPDNEPNAG